jgi:hypothetical protein
LIILDNSILHNSLYVIHSTLLGRFHTPNNLDVNPSCLVPIVSGIPKTEISNQPRVTIKILLYSGASSTLIRENWAKNLGTIQSAPQIGLPLLVNLYCLN